MLKMLFFFISSIACFLLFINSDINNNHNKKNTPVKYNIISHDGEIVGCEPAPINRMPIAKWDSPSKTAFSYDGTDNITISTQEVNMDARTTFDYQSNGAIRYLAQDPINPQYIHAVFMVDPIGAFGSPDRKTKYYTSTNMGTTWISNGNVTSVKSGFPSIDILSDRREIIGLHSSEGGFSSNIAQVYINAAPGQSTFTRLGTTSLNVGDQPEYAKIIATDNVTHNNKFFIVTSEITSRQSFTNIGLSLTTGIYLGWTANLHIGSGEANALSRGLDGRIGMVYGNNDQNFPGSIGNVYFIQSIDDGVTFSSPITIWQANFNTDSLSCIRSLDLCYTSNTPNAIFAVCVVDPVGGGYYPASLSKVLFWSPGINGGNPVTIDTCSMMNESGLQTDAFYSDCRPVIGRSSDNNVLYAAWCRARPEFDSNDNSYFDIYFSYSVNGGLNWYPKVKITNTSGPLRDCRYVSMSQSNSVVSGVNYVHLIYQMDSIPGSFVSGAQMSFARMMYAKISIDTLVGIQNPGSQVSDKFSLEQNFPNPFNPSTKMSFTLPGNEFVSLKIYNINGELISLLINGYLTKGNKEIEWNGSDMPSGVYFYTIEAGSFKQSRKMILLK